MAARGCGGSQSAVALSASAAQPTLPSLASARPLRRAVSLSTADRKNAQRHWETTLRNRLGTPGEPPGRDCLPSLYNRSPSQLRPPSGFTNAPPPSTIGPSASIVAWFAQFRCAKCSCIPMALDAKFCSSCGHPLAIVLPPELQAQVDAAARISKGSQSGKTKPLIEDSEIRVRSHSTGAARDRDQRAVRDASLRAQRGNSIQSKRGKPIAWTTRESQVAQWLGNIKPRQHQPQAQA
mmetsp:Transcript_30128/g.48588  ORF Transcript_30128/g.48588 Transcript_30128/m.48588 type:complete len:237 (+) Transcript_30128:56-766(+)